MRILFGVALGLFLLSGRVLAVSEENASTVNIKRVAAGVGGALIAGGFIAASYNDRPFYQQPAVPLATVVGTITSAIIAKKYDDSVTANAILGAVRGTALGALAASTGRSVYTSYGTSWFGSIRSVTIIGAGLAVGAAVGVAIADTIEDIQTTLKNDNPHNERSIIPDTL
ncbi:MAG: hypothetical protein LBJ92_04350 [Holosporales bacterium]|nr:hypothetical protein [Holosporales bacterium]